MTHQIHVVLIQYHLYGLEWNDLEKATEGLSLCYKKQFRHCGLYIPNTKVWCCSMLFNDKQYVTILKVHFENVMSHFVGLTSPSSGSIGTQCLQQVQ
jgi:hypothetical protein